MWLIISLKAQEVSLVFYKFCFWEIFPQLLRTDPTFSRQYNIFWKWMQVFLVLGFVFASDSALCQNSKKFCWWYQKRRITCILHRWQHERYVVKFSFWYKKKQSCKYFHTLFCYVSYINHSFFYSSCISIIISRKLRKITSRITINLWQFFLKKGQ